MTMMLTNPDEIIAAAQLKAKQMGFQSIDDAYEDMMNKKSMEEKNETKNLD